MTEECSNGRLCKSEIVRNAGKAVSQDVRSDPGEWRVCQDLAPVLRESDKRFSLDRSLKHGTGCRITLACLEQCHNRQSNRTNRRSLLAVPKPQTAIGCIDLPPVEIDDLPSPAACQRKCTNHCSCSRELIVPISITKQSTKKPVFVFRKPAIELLVGGLANSMCRVGLDNSILARIGKNSTEQTQCARPRTDATSHDRFAMLSGFLGHLSASILARTFYTSSV